jgi:Ankyrin repeats (3 copies)
MKCLAVLVCVSAMGAESNLSDQFYSVIRRGDAGAVQQLIKSGVDVNVRDSRGATPLLYAAAVGTPEIMRILIGAGADVNARTSFGATPLIWSAANLAKVKLLVENGADTNARTKLGNTVLLPPPHRRATSRYCAIYWIMAPRYRTPATSPDRRHSYARRAQAI